MTDYSELVKALRYCGNFAEREGCAESCEYFNDMDCPNRIMSDSAAAIEELQQIADHHEQSAKDYWKEACEYKAQLPKRGEWVVFNKQMLINLENAREQYKELGYPHRTELGLQCSNCRKVTYVDSGIKYEFCPHCGAKMEVQE